MPHLTALSCILLATVSMAQQEVVTHHANGQIKERFTTDGNGNRDGDYERFDPDGTRRQKQTYVAGELHGECIDFDAKGRPVAEARYSKGQRHGRSRGFIDGNLVLLANYKRGELHGRYETWQPDGARTLRTSYRKGLLHGKFEEWRLDAELHREARYDSGQLHGTAKIAIDGSTASKRTWVKGRLAILDGVEAFPISDTDLRASLKEAITPSTPDPKDQQGAAREYALAELKAYRALCRLPWRPLTLVPEWNNLCDAASEVVRANGRLSHTPKQPPGFSDDRYKEGYRGAQNSNLAGTGLTNAIDMYMDDSDPSNIDRIGHRRWCLNPTLVKTGFGVSGNWSAMWSMDSSGAAPRGIKHVYFPPKGCIPTNFFAPHVAWSIHPNGGSLPNDKTKLRVTIQKLDELFLPTGEPLELNYLDFGTGGFGSGRCLVFRPTGLEVTPGANYRCRVSLDGGKSLAHDYVVGFIAPLADKQD